MRHARANDILFILQLHRITCNEHVRICGVASGVKRRFWQGLASRLEQRMLDGRRRSFKAACAIAFACTCDRWSRCCETHARAASIHVLLASSVDAFRSNWGLDRTRRGKERGAEMRNSVSRKGRGKFRTRVKYIHIRLFLVSLIASLRLYRINCTVTIERSSPLWVFFFFYVAYIVRRAVFLTLLHKSTVFTRHE